MDESAFVRHRAKEVLSTEVDPVVTYLHARGVGKVCDTPLGKTPHNPPTW